MAWTKEQIEAKKVEVKDLLKKSLIFKFENCNTADLLKAKVIEYKKALELQFDEAFEAQGDTLKLQGFFENHDSIPDINAINAGIIEYLKNTQEYGQYDDEAITVMLDGELDTLVIELLNEEIIKKSSALNIADTKAVEWDFKDISEKFKQKLHLVQWFEATYMFSIGDAENIESLKNEIKKFQQLYKLVDSSVNFTDAEKKIQQQFTSRHDMKVLLNLSRMAVDNNTTMYEYRKMLIEVLDKEIRKNSKKLSATITVAEWNKSETLKQLRKQGDAAQKPVLMNNQQINAVNRYVENAQNINFANLHAFIDNANLRNNVSRNYHKHLRQTTNFLVGWSSLLFKAFAIYTMLYVLSYKFNFLANYMRSKQSNRKLQTMAMCMVVAFFADTLPIRESRNENLNNGIWAGYSGVAGIMVAISAYVCLQVQDDKFINLGILGSFITFIGKIIGEVKHNELERISGFEAYFPLITGIFLSFMNFQKDKALNPFTVFMCINYGLCALMAITSLSSNLVLSREEKKTYNNFVVGSLLGVKDASGYVIEDFGNVAISENTHTFIHGTSFHYERSKSYVENLKRNFKKLVMNDDSALNNSNLSLVR